MEQEDLLAFSDSDVVREAVRLAARSYDSLGASLEGSGFEKEPAAAWDLHAFMSVLGNDADGIQLGGSGETADNRTTARARMGDRGLCEWL